MRSDTHGDWAKIENAASLGLLGLICWALQVVSYL